MTYSVLGIETTQVKEIDPQTGKERIKYLPKINPQTGKEERIRLAQAARRQGTYLIGATGTGKSAAILNLGLQDIKQGKGIAVFDPHSDLINSFLARLDEDDLERVVLLDPLDETHVFGLNLYACADPTNDVLVQGTYEQVEHIFDVVWHEEGEDQFGPQVREGLLYSTYGLIYNSGTEYTGCGMLEIPLLFLEDTPRANMVKHIQDPVIRSYWEKRYEPFDRYEKARRADMVINKLNEFIANPIFRRIVGQGTTSIDFKDVMDHGKILLVKLPGRFERMAQILGAMVIAQLLGASYEREKQHKRPQFNIYADEFQQFATRDFAKLLTEASRKYNTPVTIAHQARDFIDLKNKAASLQVPNLIVLRIIRKDADEIAGNFDNTPIRTKKVLKQRTEPKYKEWDEYYWDSEEAERQYNNLEQRIKEAYQQKLQAIIRAMCAQALSEHFRDAFSSTKWHHTPNHDGLSFVRLISLSNKDEGWYKEHKAEVIDYLHHPLNPAWISFQGNGKATWSGEQVATVERNLVLRELRSETIHKHFYYWPDWWNGKCRTWDRKRVDYSYLKREEWYSFTGEAAISGVEYALQHGSWPSVITKEFPHWKGTTYSNLISMKQEVDALFRGLLEALITEVHAFVAPYYARSWLKFVPNLAPEMPWDRAKREDPYYSDGGSPPDDGEVRYPDLTNVPQPEIGQRRVTLGWITEGKWSTWKFQGAENWLINMEKRLEEQVKRSEKEVVDCENRWQQLLEEQKEFKSQHYKTAHRRDYLGEQPVKDQQISYRGEYLRITDVQWYDFAEELDQTSDQRRDEIAGEITMLPDYVARVKIKDENDEFVEYTIRTLKPEEGLHGQALHERKAQIKAAMIGNKIIRPKHEIDEEIRKRQQILRRTQLEPQHKQGILPPPEDEPHITRRG